MITYGEFIDTVALFISIARFVFDIIKYKKEQKKK